TGFLGAGVPEVARVWSKAGLTSRVRHDAAYIEAADSHPYLLVVFTEGAEHSQNEAILPFISAQLLTAAQALTKGA
ncbi:MAG: serine hydrolase, partial [Leptolyngbya sp. SIO4C1]|nr:serine hydrolase [Leptolyngbya sp. SIO4C1]